jgi:hypothetical protein
VPGSFHPLGPQSGCAAVAADPSPPASPDKSGPPASASPAGPLPLPAADCEPAWAPAPPDCAPLPAWAPLPAACAPLPAEPLDPLDPEEAFDVGELLEPQPPASQSEPPPARQKQNTNACTSVLSMLGNLFTALFPSSGPSVPSRPHPSIGTTAGSPSPIAARVYDSPSAETYRGALLAAARPSVNAVAMRSRSTSRGSEA